MLHSDLRSDSALWQELAHRYKKIVVCMFVCSGFGFGFGLFCFVFFFFVFFVFFFRYFLLIFFARASRLQK